MSSIIGMRPEDAAHVMQTMSQGAASMDEARQPLVGARDEVEQSMAQLQQAAAHFEQKVQLMLKAAAAIENAGTSITTTITNTPGALFGDVGAALQEVLQAFQGRMAKVTEIVQQMTKLDNLLRDNTLTDRQQCQVVGDDLTILTSDAQILSQDITQKVGVVAGHTQGMTGLSADTVGKLQN